MGFAGEGQTDLSHCELRPLGRSRRSRLASSDTLARALSKPNHPWKSVGGADTLFLATAYGRRGCIRAFRGAPRAESRQRASAGDVPVGSLRTGDSSADAARSPGDRRPVSYGLSPSASVVLGGPVADLEQRDPGRVPRHSDAAVSQPSAISWRCRRAQRLRWSGSFGRMRVEAFGPIAPV